MAKKSVKNKGKSAEKKLAKAQKSQIKTANKNIDRLAKRLKAKPASSSVWRFSFSYIGIVFGVLFFALSLTPSLLPRDALFQGLISGILTSIGYGIGTLLQATWEYLGLPKFSMDAAEKLSRWVVSFLTLLTILFMWQFVGWQNNVRVAVELNTKISPLALIPIILLAALFDYVFNDIARSIAKFSVFIYNTIAKIASRRVAVVVSTFATG